MAPQQARSTRRFTNPQEILSIVHHVPSSSYATLINMGADALTSKARLSELLATCVRLLRQDFYQRTPGLQLTPALARLLFFIDRDAGCSQVDLAARLEVTPVTLGRMLDRLVQCGYVRREPDPQDRRVLRAHIDKAGEPLVLRMNKLRTLTEARATRGLTKSQQKVLAAQLLHICRNLADDSH